MKRKQYLPLRSFRLKNFKAVKDSGEVRFTPLTVFIGNNGSGKSSLIEGLQTYQDITSKGLDEAMNRWRGFEHIHNPPIDLMGLRGNQSKSRKNPVIQFMLSGDSPEKGQFQAWLDAEMSLNGDDVFISEERVNLTRRKFVNRNSEGNIKLINILENGALRINHGLSVLNPQAANDLMNTLFMNDYILAGEGNLYNLSFG